MSPASHPLCTRPHTHARTLSRSLARSFAHTGFTQDVSEFINIFFERVEEAMQDKVCRKGLSSALRARVYVRAWRMWCRREDMYMYEFVYVCLCLCLCMLFEYACVGVCMRACGTRGKARGRGEMARGWDDARRTCLAPTCLAPRRARERCLRILCG